MLEKGVAVSLGLKLKSKIGEISNNKTYKLQEQGLLAACG
jgi:hypothetical protein